LNLKLPPFHWWRTVFFLIPAITLYTIVLGTLSLGSSLFETHGRFAHWCARTWSRLILATTGVRVDVAGLDRLDPARAYVFVSNHQSIYDIPIVFWALPYQIRIIAKSSLGRFPFIGWHLARTGHMLVDRKQPARALAIFASASKLMKQGLCLIVFPEGTRSRDGRVAPFKGGSFYLALQAGLPIVPLSIVGSRHIMLKGRLATYPGRVTLVVHEPIDTSGVAGGDPRAARAFAARVHDMIAPDAEADVMNVAPSTL
jgi:1-acyl-sn-glycerol-3-phosphate acyltransferase